MRRPLLDTYSRFGRTLVVALVTALVWSGVSAPAPAPAEILNSDRLAGRSPKEIGLPKAAMPDVQMAAGALVSEDGRLLWMRRGSDRRAMASLTKIMTAVIAVENSEPNELVTIPREAGQVGESTSFLRAGEKLPMSELLEALLVKSGNDAAVAVAMHVAGSEEAFVTLMNEKAKRLGLARTKFDNPHGLDSSGHYSTAVDLAVLSRYAMTKPEFRRIVAQQTIVLGSGGRSERMHTTNLLVGNYEGANGVKTGFTSDAGYCVVDSARRGSVEIYAVVLGCRTEMQRFRDARDLLDFGFAHYRPRMLISAGTVVGEAPVKDYLDRTVGAQVSESTTATIFDLAGPITRSVKVSTVKAPVEKGQRVGVATFTQGGEVVATVPLVATEDVKKPNIFLRVGIAIARVWRWVTGYDG